MDYLSPFLFALFINDLYKYIEGKYKRLSINNCYPTLLDDDIVMLNKFVLLYADDTIVLTENACKLQKALDVVHCGMYKLSYSLEENENVFPRSNMEIIQLTSSVIIFTLALT